MLAWTTTYPGFSLFSSSATENEKESGFQLQKPVIKPRTSSITDWDVVVSERERNARQEINPPNTKRQLPLRNQSLGDLLIGACMEGDFFAVKYLHQKSAPLNITTPWSSTGWTHILPRDTQMVLTPLTAACAYGHKEIVEYLVENGVGVCGGSVFVSVVAENVGITKYLMEHAGDLSLMMDEGVGGSALGWAVRMDCLEMVSLLLSYLPSSCTKMVCEAVEEGVNAGHCGVVRLLLRWLTGREMEMEGVVGRWVWLGVEKGNWGVVKVVVDWVVGQGNDSDREMDMKVDLKGVDEMDHDAISSESESEFEKTQSETALSIPNFNRTDVPSFFFESNSAQLPSPPLRLPSTTTLFAAPVTPTPKTECTNPLESYLIYSCSHHPVQRSILPVSVSTPGIELSWEDVMVDFDLDGDGDVDTGIDVGMRAISVPGRDTDTHTDIDTDTGDDGFSFISDGE